MSTWIYITNLPYYVSCRAEVIREFEKEIGSIRRCEVMDPDPVSRSTKAFVQYKQPKHAKLAAHKKDSTVVGNRAIQVYLIWSPKESLSTIKIQNLPMYIFYYFFFFFFFHFLFYNCFFNHCLYSSISNDDLQDEFNAWGEIVDSQINFNSNGSPEGHISYSKVDYAIQVECFYYYFYYLLFLFVV